MNPSIWLELLNVRLIAVHHSAYYTVVISWALIHWVHVADLPRIIVDSRLHKTAGRIGARTVVNMLPACGSRKSARVETTLIEGDDMKWPPLYISFLKTALTFVNRIGSPAPSPGASTYRLMRVERINRGAPLFSFRR